LAARDVVRSNRPLLDQSVAVDAEHDGSDALYAGLCLIEGTSVSVGRGTFEPFEIGAPYIDGVKLAAN